MAGFNFVRTSTNINTSEGNYLKDGILGAPVTYAITLMTHPGPVGDDSRQVVLDFTSSDLTEGTLVPSALLDGVTDSKDTFRLTFDGSNWDIPHIITITGVDDMRGADVPTDAIESMAGGRIAEGAISYTISGVVNQAETTALEYKTLFVPTQTLQNDDDSQDIPINEAPGNLGTSGVDYMVGSNLNDDMYASYGYDELQGGFGDDLLFGEQGNDVFYGQQGNDTLWGGYQTDTLNGDDGNDTLYGEQDPDYLSGGAGNDYLDGGLNADTMSGGIGNDTYVVDDLKDSLDDQGASIDVDTVLVNIPGNAPYTYTLPGNIENGTLQATGNHSLLGNAANNRLNGNDGNNSLNGGWGNDMLNGGKGTDTYIVDSTGDKIIEEAGAANGNKDVVQAGVSFTLPKNVENLTLTGSAAINGRGNVQGNTITGNGVVNIIDAGAGNDIINAGNGNDILTGGTGKDSFVLGTGGMDKIIDFKPVDDTILLPNSLLASVGIQSGLLASGFLAVGNQAQDANDYLIYSSTTGALYYDTDGNGPLPQVQIGLLGLNLGVTNADILVQ